MNDFSSRVLPPDVILAFKTKLDRFLVNTNSTDEKTSDNTNTDSSSNLASSDSSHSTRRKRSWTVNKEPTRALHRAVNTLIIYESLNRSPIHWKCVPQLRCLPSRHLNSICGAIVKKKRRKRLLQQPEGQIKENASNHHSDQKVSISSSEPLSTPNEIVHEIEEIPDVITISSEETKSPVEKTFRSPTTPLKETPVKPKSYSHSPTTPLKETPAKPKSPVKNSICRFCSVVLDDRKSKQCSDCRDFLQNWIRSYERLEELVCIRDVPCCIQWPTSISNNSRPITSWCTGCRVTRCMELGFTPLSIYKVRRGSTYKALKNINRDTLLDPAFQHLGREKRFKEYLSQLKNDLSTTDYYLPVEKIECTESNNLPVILDTLWVRPIHLLSKTQLENKLSDFNVSTSHINPICSDQTEEVKDPQSDAADKSKPIYRMDALTPQVDCVWCSIRHLLNASSTSMVSGQLACLHLQTSRYSVTLGPTRLYNSPTSNDGQLKSINSNASGQPVDDSQTDSSLNDNDGQLGAAKSDINNDLSEPVDGIHIDSSLNVPVDSSDCRMDINEPVVCPPTAHDSDQPPPTSLNDTTVPTTESDPANLVDSDHSVKEPENTIDDDVTSCLQITSNDPTDASLGDQPSESSIDQSTISHLTKEITPCNSPLPDVVVSASTSDVPSPPPPADNSGQLSSEPPACCIDTGIENCDPTDKDVNSDIFASDPVSPEFNSEVELCGLCLAQFRSSMQSLQSSHAHASSDFILDLVSSPTSFCSCSDDGELCQSCFLHRCLTQLAASLKPRPTDDDSGTENGVGSSISVGGPLITPHLLGPRKSDIGRSLYECSIGFGEFSGSKYPYDSRLESAATNHSSIPATALLMGNKTTPFSLSCSICRREQAALTHYRFDCNSLACSACLASFSQAIDQLGDNRRFISRQQQQLIMNLIYRTPSKVPVYDDDWYLLSPLIDVVRIADLLDAPCTGGSCCREDLLNSFQCQSCVVRRCLRLLPADWPVKLPSWIRHFRRRSSLTGINLAYLDPRFVVDPMLQSPSKTATTYRRLSQQNCQKLRLINMEYSSSSWNKAFPTSPPSQDANQPPPIASPSKSVESVCIVGDDDNDGDDIVDLIPSSSNSIISDHSSTYGGASWWMTELSPSQSDQDEDEDTDPETNVDLANTLKMLKSPKGGPKSPLQSPPPKAASEQSSPIKSPTSREDTIVSATADDDEVSGDIDSPPPVKKRKPEADADADDGVVLSQKRRVKLNNRFTDFISKDLHIIASGGAGRQTDTPHSVSSTSGSARRPRSRLHQREDIDDASSTTSSSSRRTTGRSSTNTFSKRRHSAGWLKGARGRLSASSKGRGDGNMRRSRGNGVMRRQCPGPRVKQVSRSSIGQGSQFAPALSAMVQAARLAAVGAKLPDGVSPEDAAAAASSITKSSKASRQKASEGRSTTHHPGETSRGSPSKRCGQCPACTGLIQPCGECVNCRTLEVQIDSKNRQNFPCKQLTCFKRRPRVKMPTDSRSTPSSQSNSGGSGSSQSGNSRPVEAPSSSTLNFHSTSLFDTVPELEHQLRSDDWLKADDDESQCSARKQGRLYRKNDHQSLHAYADRPDSEIRGGELGMRFNQQSSTASTTGSSQEVLDADRLRPIEGEIIDQQLSHQGGYAVVTTQAAAPPKELCYSCGSGGGQLLFCVSCAEPFHFYCIEGPFRPKRKDHFICRNCTACKACKKPGADLRCVKCSQGYHPSCLPDFPPAQATSNKGNWTCPSCSTCLHCGRRPCKQPGSSSDQQQPRALANLTSVDNRMTVPWSGEPTRCAACSLACDRGDLCPECDRAYLPTTAHMVQCDSCSLWMHRTCCKLTADEYECIARMPSNLLGKFVVNCSSCQGKRKSRGGEQHRGTVQSAPSPGAGQLKQLANDTLMERMATLVSACRRSSDLTPADRVGGSSTGQGRSRYPSSTSSGSNAGPTGRFIPQVDGIADSESGSEVSSQIDNNHLLDDQLALDGEIDPEVASIQGFNDHGQTIVSQLPSPVANSNKLPIARGHNLPATKPVNNLHSHDSTISDKSKDIGLSPTDLSWAIDGESMSIWTTPRALVLRMLYRILQRLLFFPSSHWQNHEIRRGIRWLTFKANSLFPWLSVEEMVTDVRDTIRRCNGKSGQIEEHFDRLASLELYDLCCPIISRLIQLHLHSRTDQSPYTDPSLVDKCFGCVGDHARNCHDKTFQVPADLHGSSNLPPHSYILQARHCWTHFKQSTCPRPHHLASIRDTRYLERDSAWVDYWSDLEEKAILSRFRATLGKTYRQLHSMSSLSNSDGLFDEANPSRSASAIEPGLRFYALAKPSPGDRDDVHRVDDDGDDLAVIFEEEEEQENKKPLSSSSSTTQDQRRCLLCGLRGDVNIEGRLLFTGADSWVHVNCALWSNEVYEEESGQLVGLSDALRRARDSVCFDCHQPGATLYCANSTDEKCCPMIEPGRQWIPRAVHFACALRRAYPQAQRPLFTADRSFFCSPSCHEAVTSRRIAHEVARYGQRRCRRRSWSPHSDSMEEDDESDSSEGMVAGDNSGHSRPTNLTSDKLTRIEKAVLDDLEPIALGDFLVCRRVFTPSNCFALSVSPTRHQSAAVHSASAVDKSQANIESACQALATSPHSLPLLLGQGLPASSLVVTVGSLRIDRLGEIREASDSLVEAGGGDGVLANNFICPINYRARRIFWSTRSIDSRVSYTMQIGQCHTVSPRELISASRSPKKPSPVMNKLPTTTTTTVKSPSEKQPVLSNILQQSRPILHQQLPTPRLLPQSQPQPVKVRGMVSSMLTSSMTPGNKQRRRPSFRLTAPVPQHHHVNPTPITPPVGESSSSLRIINTSLSSPKYSDCLSLYTTGTIHHHLYSSPTVSLSAPHAAVKPNPINNPTGVVAPPMYRQIRIIGPNDQHLTPVVNQLPPQQQPPVSRLGRALSSSGKQPARSSLGFISQLRTSLPVATVQPSFVHTPNNNNPVVTDSNVPVKLTPTKDPILANQLHGLFQSISNPQTLSNQMTGQDKYPPNSQLVRVWQPNEDKTLPGVDKPDQPNRSSLTRLLLPQLDGAGDSDESDDTSSISSRASRRSTTNTKRLAVKRRWTVDRSRQQELAHLVSQAKLATSARMYQNEFEKHARAFRLKFTVDNIVKNCNSPGIAWQSVMQSVVALRQKHKLPAPISSVNAWDQFGISHRHVVFLLEQMQGAFHCYRYRFQYHWRKVEHLRQKVLPTYIAEAVVQATGLPVTTTPNKPESESKADITKQANFNLGSSSESELAGTPDEASSQDESDNESVKPYGPDDEQEQEQEEDEEMQSDAVQFSRIVSGSLARLLRVSVHPSGIHGRGLFSLRGYHEDEMVIEYTGQLIRSVICEARELRYRATGVDCYMFRIDQDWVIDATYHGNAARFINHSCDPNCYAKIVTVDDCKHIVILSQRRIYPGEELTYDYRFPKESDKLLCNCGSFKCRKYLN